MAKKTLLKEKSAEELTKLLREKRGSLRDLRFAAAGSRPKDSNAPLKTRREIARVLTELGTRRARESATTEFPKSNAQGTIGELLSNGEPAKKA